MMNNISKNVERRCLDIVRHIKHYDFLQGEIIEDERPDFIIGSVGIEHFLIDVITNDCSINRKQSTSIKKKINYYKMYPNKLDEDIASDKATKYIQDIINEQIGGISSFDYKTFADNFQRVFDKHYKNIPTYKTKCNTLGFLIEIPYIKPIGPYGYIITNKGKKRTQVVKTIPITRDMIKCFKYIDNVDFIILCMIPINYKNDYSECQIIKIDMDDVEQDIRKQGMIICDEFDFPLKFSNKDVVHLKTEHTNTIKRN